MVFTDFAPQEVLNKLVNNQNTKEDIERPRYIKGVKLIISTPFVFLN